MSEEILENVYNNPITWFKKFCTYEVHLVVSVSHAGVPPVRDRVIVETSNPYLLYQQFKKAGTKLLGNYITGEKDAVYEITKVEYSYFD